MQAASPASEKESGGHCEHVVLEEAVHVFKIVPSRQPVTSLQGTHGSTPDPLHDWAAQGGEGRHLS